MKCKSASGLLLPLLCPVLQFRFYYVGKMVLVWELMVAVYSLVVAWILTH